MGQHPSQNRQLKSLEEPKSADLAQGGLGREKGYLGVF